MDPEVDRLVSAISKTIISNLEFGNDSVVRVIRDASRQHMALAGVSPLRQTDPCHDVNPPRFIGHTQVGLFCFISLVILIIGKQLVDEAERLAKEILDGIIKGADLPDDES